MPLFTGDQLEEHVEDISYWCYPFLQRKGTLVIGAEPKSLKTYLAIQFSLAMVSGKDFLGWPTEKARVLYIDQEIGASAFKKRYQPLKKHFSLVHPDVHIWTKDKDEILLDPGTVAHTRLHELLDAVRPDVVVFDSLRKTTNSDENSSTEMVKVFKSLTRLQETFNFSSVLIHHASKPNENQRRGTPQVLRGSGEIYAHGDSYAIITHPTTDNDKIDVHWRFRNHEDIEPLKLMFHKDRGIFLRRQDESKKKGISDGLLKAK